MVMVVMALTFGIVALPAVVVMVMMLVFILVMVVVVAAALVLVIIVVMVVAAALVLIVVMVVVVMLMPALLLEKLKLCLKGVALFHGLQYLGACQLAPGGDYEGGMWVVFPEKGYIGIQLIRAYLAGAAEYNCVGVLYLVVEELPEVLHIHLALVCIHNGREAVKLQGVRAYVLHRPYNVAELAHAGGLYKYAVGGVLVHNLPECLAEVAYQAAADTAGVHLGNFYAGVLHEAAVYAYLAEFVLYQHKLFAAVGLGYELLYKGGLASAQETRENIDLGHLLLHLFPIVFSY